MSKMHIFVVALIILACFAGFCITISEKNDCEIRGGIYAREMFRFNIFGECYKAVIDE